MAQYVSTTTLIATCLVLLSFSSCKKPEKEPEDSGGCSKVWSVRRDQAKSVAEVNGGHLLLEMNNGKVGAAATVFRNDWSGDLEVEVGYRNYFIASGNFGYAQLMLYDLDVPDTGYVMGMVSTDTLWAGTVRTGSEQKTWAKPKRSAGHTAGKMIIKVAGGKVERLVVSGTDTVRFIGGSMGPGRKGIALQIGGMYRPISGLIGVRWDDLVVRKNGEEVYREPFGCNTMK